MAGTVYSGGTVFPPGFTSGEGDSFGPGCIFTGPALFLEGCVFQNNCVFNGSAEGPIVFGKGNVFGPNCSFQFCVFGEDNIVGNTYINLGGNTSLDPDTLLGGPPMFTLNRAHVHTTGIPSSAPLLVCDAAIIENPHGAVVDHEVYCPPKEYGTYQGSTGNSGTPAPITRTP